MTAGIYHKTVLIDPSKHAKHRMDAIKDFGFSKSLNTVCLEGVELSDACKEYAIVFINSVEGPLPFAILGLSNRQNAYLDAVHKWTADYVPAYIRRYPYVLARMEDAADETQWGVCVDESCAAWNTTQGESLFGLYGEKTPYLMSVLEFLLRYQSEHKKTVAFGQKLAELGLLKTMSAKVNLSNGRSFDINGFQVVDEDKLATLSPEQTLELTKTGYLYWIYAHKVSLSNLQKLPNRIEATALAK